jgi:hypothetical protein
LFLSLDPELRAFIVNGAEQYHIPCATIVETQLTLRNKRCYTAVRATAALGARRAGSHII